MGSSWIKGERSGCHAHLAETCIRNSVTLGWLSRSRRAALARGLSKQDAKIDLWPKEAAPSTELRRWFNHEPDKWVEFKRRYFKELRTRQESLTPILERVRAGRVTFVFASRETRFNNAVALKEYLERVKEEIRIARVEGRERFRKE